MKQGMTNFFWAKQGMTTVRLYDITDVKGPKSYLNRI